LIALLNSDGSLPTATATTAATTIRPRGLVNSGNMYFANAVLQMLVYTPPFQKLFVELGRLKGAKDNKGKKKNTDKTPLVDAMIEFVKEFVLDDVRSANGYELADGWGGGNETEWADGWGRGNEMEWEDGGEDEGMWEKSFIPTYVYDALKKTKRFDDMGVCVWVKD
jgi:ubiquitin carboxyl-terminal hydrolase 10